MGYMEFLLAVLGTNIFWGVYFLMSIVFTIVFTKKCFPTIYYWITGQKEKIEWEINGIDYTSFSFGILLIMSFWPLILTSIILFYLFKLVFWMIGKAMLFIFTSVDKVIPDLDIKIEKKRD